MPTNMMQFIQMVQNQGNPQQFLLSMLESQNNPLYSNIANLVRNNKTNEVELIIRNMMKERGVDFDTEFGKFKKMLNL